MAKITVEYLRKIFTQLCIGDISEEKAVELLNEKASEGGLKAYAIKDPKGKVKIQDIKDFEDECIDCFLDSFLICITWQILKSQGYRCVPVEITEITPKPLSGKLLKALHKAIKASEKKSTELKDRK